MDTNELFLWEHGFISSGCNLREGIICKCLSEIPQAFSKVDTPFTFPPALHKGSDFSSTHQHLPHLYISHLYILREGCFLHLDFSPLGDVKTWLWFKHPYFHEYRTGLLRVLRVVLRSRRGEEARVLVGAFPPLAVEPSAIT